VEAVNEWLPLAEAELKFRALPDEEDGLIRWIENHEVSTVCNAGSSSLIIYTQCSTFMYIFTYHLVKFSV